MESETRLFQYSSYCYDSMVLLYWAVKCVLLLQFHYECLWPANAAHKYDKQNQNNHALHLLSQWSRPDVRSQPRLSTCQVPRPSEDLGSNLMRSYLLTTFTQSSLMTTKLPLYSEHQLRTWVRCPVCQKYNEQPQEAGSFWWGPSRHCKAVGLNSGRRGWLGRLWHALPPWCSGYFPGSLWGVHTCTQQSWLEVASVLSWAHLAPLGSKQLWKKAILKAGGMSEVEDAGVCVTYLHCTGPGARPRETTGGLYVLKLQVPTLLVLEFPRINNNLQ